MDRNERFEITASADKNILIGLAETIASDSQVTTVKGPLSGMLMMRVRETVEGTNFNFGEVLVSEAEVMVSGSSGYMMMLGQDTEKVLAGAILDAAVEANHPLSNRIIEALEHERDRLLRERNAEWSEVAQTRVNFEVVQQ